LTVAARPLLRMPIHKRSMEAMKKALKVTVLPGDGVGPEVVREGVRVLEAVARMYSVSLSMEEGVVGGAALERCGVPLPEDTLSKVLRSDAVLLGAVGDGRWAEGDYALRPEKGLLELRRRMRLFANLRPVRVYPQLIEVSALKPDRVQGTDVLIVRELIGGLYFGEPRGIETTPHGEQRAFNTMEYSAGQIERVARLAYSLAAGRRKRLTSVDKANVLEVSLLWRKIVTELGSDYPEVTLEHLLVDNCAMQLVRDPRQFDVILTENLFGDILSDEAAMIAGSIGMLPSASLGGDGSALYEPVHGSAPDIQGKDIANPIATILSVAMMCRYSLACEPAARSIEEAVVRTLEEGYRTRDISLGGDRVVGTREMGERILAHMRTLRR
jgi:3-isopropylmalate dehydrogenase